MKVRRAKLEDLKIVNAWTKHWKMEEIQDWFLPEENYMIDEVIFASLYQTDSKVAYMENVVGNPFCPSAIRKAGLAVLGPHIFNRARTLGFKVIIGWTSNKSVAKTSQEHGMILTPFTNAAMVKVL